MEAVSRYMLLGNMRVVSEQLNVPYSVLADWKRSDWWPEMVDSLKRQKKSKTNEHLTKIIETSLEAVTDRLENGDYFFNQKTGKVDRKPVSVRDASTIATTLLQRQIQLEELVDRSQKTEDTVADVLSKIALEFKRWNKNTATDIDYVEVTPSAIHDQRETRLQERSGEVYEQTISNQEASGTEQSPSNDDEGRKST